MVAGLYQAHIRALKNGTFIAKGAQVEIRSNNLLLHLKSCVHSKRRRGCGVVRYSGGEKQHRFGKFGLVDWRGDVLTAEAPLFESALGKGADLYFPTDEAWKESCRAVI